MVANENNKPDFGLACLVLLVRFHGVAVEAEQVRHRLGSIAAVGVSEMLRRGLYGGCCPRNQSGHGKPQLGRPCRRTVYVDALPKETSGVGA